MPLLIKSRAVALLRSRPAAKPRQTISLSVTMPTSRSFSPMAIAPILCSRLMREHNIGAIAIGEKDRLLGLGTDKGIFLRGVGAGLGPMQGKPRAGLGKGS